MMGVKKLLLILCLFGVYDAVYSACSRRKATPLCLYSTELPDVKDRFMPSVGNGYVATIAMSDTIHIAGVYNGKANITYVNKDDHVLPIPEKAHKKWNKDFVAHRARVPSSVSVNFTLDLPGTRSYALDVEDGVFYQWFDSEEVHIEQRIYAHRTRTNILINEIIVDTNTDFYMTYVPNMGAKVDDINMKLRNVSRDSQTASGPIRYPEIDFATYVALACTRIPKGVHVRKSSEKQTFRFVASLSTNLHSTDPMKKCMAEYDSAIKSRDLFSTHVTKWNSIWKYANISLQGDLYLSQLVPASLYYLLSQVNERFAHGVSPGGLAGGEEYYGHVFWDQDVWMYPSILMLFPDVAKSLLQYRQKRVKAAQMIAKKYGYKGAMYPWESALTGYEVCPEHVYGLHELHINGDIAFAQRQYYFATKDLDWLANHGYDVIFQTATFWASRVEYDKKNDRYVINDVMPPDEYAYPVNNSIYTNTIAQLNLEIAIRLGRLLKIDTPKSWEQILSKMYLPFDPVLEYHPEYEHFDIRKDRVKQADTILINYPLMANIPKKVKENDLKLYAHVTNPNGPAMTHSMFSIGWLDVGNKENAATSFKRNYENIKGPFKVWCELRSGNGATNFMTGAGGFLQSVLFGYGGLRLKEDGLYFKLQLTPDSQELHLNGVKYLGNSIQFNRMPSTCTVTVLNYLPSAKPLYVRYASGKEKRLTRTTILHVCEGKIFHKKTIDKSIKLIDI